MKKLGFTLVELLVVLGILILLLALLFPVLSAIRRHAKKTQCIGNLHQYGLAATAYTIDHEDHFPNPYRWLRLRNITGWCQWHDERNNLIHHPEDAGPLWHYLDRRPEIHLCPEFLRLAPLKGADHPYHYQHPEIPIEAQNSYSQNAYLGRAEDDSVLKVTQVSRPAGIFWYSEENMWTIPDRSYVLLNDTALWIKSPPYQFGKYASECFATYHNPPGGDLNLGSANAVFVDGHVDSISRQEDASSLARPH